MNELEPKMAWIEWKMSPEYTEYFQPKETKHQLKTIYSIGYVIEDTKEKLILASSMSEFNYGGILVIPRQAITHMEYLGYVR